MHSEERHFADDDNQITVCVKSSDISANSFIQLAYSITSKGMKLADNE